MLAARGRGQSFAAIATVLGWWLAADVARAEQAPPEPAPAEAAASEATPGADDGDDPSEPVHSLDAIVVTGSRTERPLGETPVATEVITPSEIRESGAQNLGELLEERIGVYIDRSSVAGAAVQLQGLPADYTLILVDGVRQPGRINGAIDLDRFSIEDIERVEIVRGSSSALYGSDAIAGVINIITKKAKRPLEIDGTGSLGAYQTIDASGSIGLNRPRWSTRLSAGYHSRGSYDLDPSDPATSQSESVQYNFDNQSTFSPSRGFTLTSSLDYRNQDRNAVDVSAAGGALFDRENLTETGSVLLKPEWKFDGGTRLELRGSLGIFRDQFLLDQRGSNELDEVQDTREYNAQLGTQLDTLVAESHLVSVGAETWYETLDTVRLASGSSERSRVSVYAQDEWTLHEGPLVVLLPGARVDIDSQFGAYPTPRLAMRVDPIEQLTLRASYGWGFKAPDFRELYLLFENPSVGYLVEGNPDLEPERSRSYNLSAELRPHPNVSLSVQGFLNQLSNRIGTILAPSDEVGPRRFIYQNVDAASSMGIESSIRVSPVKALRLDFGYSWTRSENRADGQPLSGQPLQRATAAIAFAARSIGFEASCRTAVVGPRPFYQDTNGDDIVERQDSDPYATVDVRLAQRVGYGFDTFLVGENLLNAGDAQFLTIPPRTFSGGIRYDY